MLVLFYSGINSKVKHTCITLKETVSQMYSICFAYRWSQVKFLESSIKLSQAASVGNDFSVRGPGQVQKTEDGL